MAVTSGTRVLTNIVRILAASLLALAALVLLVLPVQAATATTLTLTITPSTVIHSSATQSAILNDISALLTAGGTGLPGRGIELSYRAVGTIPWTSFTAIGSGAGSSVMSLEGVVGGVCGDYEFKAAYIPAGGDIGVYDASESIVSFTLLPHPIESTITTLSITPSTFIHSSATQSAILNNISALLTVGGTGLPGRGIELSYRLVGAIPWTSFTAIGSGAGSSVISLEGVVGGVCGDYQMKAEFIPTGGDATDYSGSEDIVAFTLSPHPIESTSVALSVSPGTVIHSSASQPYVVSNITALLSAGGTEITPARGITISYRLIGAGSWTIFNIIGSGAVSTVSYPLEVMVSGVSGAYEMKAEFIPTGGDATDYSGSEDIVAFTVSPHPIEATAVDLTISPSTVERQSSVQPMVISNITALLSAGGIEISPRGIVLSYRLVGAGSWTLFNTIGSGAANMVSYPLEIMVGGVTGNYELKAEFIPTGGDATDYSGSADIKPFTVLPSSTDIGTATISGHAAFVTQASSTGVTVHITDTSLADGFQFTVTSEYMGTTPPPGTTGFSATSYVYYDVQVLPVIPGPLGPDVMVAVEITNPTFTSSSLLRYWSGSAWDTVTSGFTAPHTITFTVPATSLSGTPFVVFFGPLLVSVGGQVYPVNKAGILTSSAKTGLAWVLVLTGVIVAISRLRKKIRPNSSKR
jgi:hypothetical protein